MDLLHDGESIPGPAHIQCIDIAFNEGGVRDFIHLYSSVLHRSHRLIAQLVRPSSCVGIQQDAVAELIRSQAVSFKVLKRGPHLSGVVCSALQGDGNGDYPVKFAEPCAL